MKKITLYRMRALVFADEILARIHPQWIFELVFKGSGNKCAFIKGKEIELAVFEDGTIRDTNNMSIITKEEAVKRLKNAGRESQIDK